MRLATLLLALAAAGCGRIAFDTHDASLGDAPDGADADDSGDASATLGPFDAPTQITALADPGQDDDPTATGDLLELYFASARLGAAGGYADIFVSKRASTLDPWPAPTPVTELNTSYEDQAPGITRDGLTIYFSSRRPAGGRSNVWVSTRATRIDAWSTPVMVAELAGTVDEFEPQPDSWGLRFVLYRALATGNDIFESTRAAVTDAWGAPQPVDSVNTAMHAERSPCLAAGGHELWFGSDRDTAAGIYDIYVAYRATNGDPFGTATPVPELNGPDIDDDPWLSPDGRTVLFTSTRTGNYEIYEAHR